MKKVCIALDYSSTSQKLAEAGYNFAKALNAEVALLHVLDDHVFYGIDEETIMGYDTASYDNPEEFTTRITEDMMGYLNSTANHLGPLVVRKELAVGLNEDEILKFAKSWKADFIVLGTHGHSDIHNLVMGNTAVKIVKHSNIPLLIIPANN